MTFEHIKTITSKKISISLGHQEAFRESDGVEIDSFYRLSEADYRWQVKNYGEGEYLNDARPGDIVFFDGELFCDQETIRGYDLGAFNDRGDDYSGVYSYLLKNWPENG